ncbi:MAG TPA: VOC family protein [Acetobacteraceae bacterium]|nr:VOC family protein [Acetobacteraceae bacterium]
MTHDVERAKAFYTRALDWSFEAKPMDGFTYWLAKAGDQMAGGMIEMNGPEFAAIPEHWLAYVAVDDVDARTRKAVAAGATAVREPFDIPDVGRIAILRDAAGAVIGLITPAS